MALIPQKSNWSGTFFAVSYSKLALDEKILAFHTKRNVYLKRFSYRPFIFAYNEFTLWCDLRGKPDVIKKLNLKAAAVSRMKCEAIYEITIRTKY